MEYEKLQDFCDFCGLVGHVVTECGDGIYKSEDCEWGNWLLVIFDRSGGRQGAGRGMGQNGDGAGRGGGFGKGRGNPGDHNPQEGLAMDIDAKNPNGVIVLTA